MKIDRFTAKEKFTPNKFRNKQNPSENDEKCQPASVIDGEQFVTWSIISVYGKERTSSVSFSFNTINSHHMKTQGLFSVPMISKD